MFGEHSRAGAFDLRFATGNWSARERQFELA